MIEISKDTKLLSQNTVDWDFSNPPFNLEEFAVELVSLMNEKKGLGIAANQVGHSYRIFAMTGSPENYVFVNPKIVNMEGLTSEAMEGCLSFPGLGFKIERYNELRLRFMAPDGQTYTKKFKGMSARIIQHEMDHLNGIPFWSSLSKLKFDIGLKKAYKRGWKDYCHLTYNG